ncbi:MAG: glycine cleavage system protein GcvH [Thermodesulfobacteriota bacterium]
MDFPEELKYTKEHEWIAIEQNTAMVGITDFAQDSLGDVVYLELPQAGTEVEKDSPFGVVESVKSVSDLYAPLSGKIFEVNTPLMDQPETINEDPYNDGWMVRIEIDDQSEVDNLLSVEEYKEFIEEEK